MGVYQLDTEPFFFFLICLLVLFHSHYLSSPFDNWGEMGRGEKGLFDWGYSLYLFFSPLRR